MKSKQNKVKEEGKVNHNNQSKSPFQYRYKRNNILMKISIIITTPKAMEVNLEVKDHTEVKILIDPLEAKIPMAEAN